MQVLDVFRDHADAVTVVTGEIGIHQMPADQLGLRVFAAAAAQDFSDDSVKRGFLNQHVGSSSIQAETATRIVARRSTLGDPRQRPVSSRRKLIG